MGKREKEKALKRKESADKRPTATAKYIRIASSKVEIVLDLVRGKDYEVAVAILKNTNKSACLPILKVLQSAAANAENNLNIMKDNLYIAEAWATSGPTLKRMMPRARGRADRILKRTSNIRIILDEKKETEQPKKTVKKEVAVAKKESVKATSAKANKAEPKEVPDTQSERPLTEKPNSKKPMGAKKAPSANAKTTKPKAEATVKKGAK